MELGWKTESAMKNGGDGIGDRVELVESAAFRAFQKESPDVVVPEEWRSEVMAAVRCEASQFIPFPTGIDTLLIRAACAVAVLAVAVSLAASSFWSAPPERKSSLEADIQSLYGDDYASDILFDARGGGG